MKKAQLSYEYIVIIGSVLVLLLPFFYTFFNGIASKINDYYATETVNLVAQATRTVANLGEGSKVRVPLRIQGIQKNDIQRSTVALDLPKGKISAQGASCIGAAPSILRGTGTFFMPVTSFRYMIAVGDAPVISHVVPEGEKPRRENCFQPATIYTNDEFDIYGANFKQNSEVIVTRTDNNNKQTKRTEYKSEQKLEVDEPVLGAATYIMEVIDASGVTSNSLIVQVNPPALGGAD